VPNPSERERQAQPDAPSREHCWHYTGDTLASDPPQHQAVCCFCGGARVRTEVVWSPPGHGPHFRPFSTRILYRGGDGPCVPKGKP
jgi:hypothetical protein